MSGRVSHDVCRDFEESRDGADLVNLKLSTLQLRDNQILTSLVKYLADWNVHVYL